MSQHIPLHRSLKGRLGGIALALALILLALVAVSRYALSRSHATVRGMESAGRGRVLGSKLLFLVDSLPGKDDSSAALVRQSLDATMSELNDRFQEQARADGDTATTEQNRENRELWSQRIVPELTRVAAGDALGPTQRVALRANLESLVAGIDEQILLAQGSADAQYARWTNLLLVLAALAVAVLLLAAWGVWSITRRIRGLADTADRIARGDLELSARVAGQDELATLGGAFDSMTANLRATIGKAIDERTRTQAILNSTADGIMTLDEEGTLKSLNEAAQAMFGYRPEEVVGGSAARLAPALYQEGSGAYEDRELRSGETHVLAEECIVSGIRRDGSKFPLALRVSEMSYRGERLYIATVQDVTERRRAEEERERLFDGIREAVSRLSAASAEILASTTQQATGAQEQAAAVTETVVTVDEVAQTASQAAEHAKVVAESARRVDEVGRAGRKSIEDSIASMNSLREQVESVAENILELAERAQAIGEIIATVHEIAERTNLLALNAAIEASRAGEQGRGFAVVAGEVKALAEQSKKATGQVRQILGEIQRATNTAVLSTEQGTKAVAEAAAVVGRADETIRALAEMLTASARAAAQIVASVGQQATGTSQINEAMKSIDLATKQSLASTRQAEQSARDLNLLGQALRAMIEGNGQSLGSNGGHVAAKRDVFAAAKGNS
jgi:PAS domain S-box-containing protein